ncbi:MAG: alpha/beta fold hydrolase [Haloglomus sp.]
MNSHTVVGGGDTRIHVEETGDPDGPAILFLHDLSYNRLVWRKQLQSDLADEFRLLSMDLRGHGESEEPDGGYGDARIWAEDVRAVLESFDLSDVTIVAWGYGGVCAADYFQTYGTDGVGGFHLVGGLTEIGTQIHDDATPTDLEEMHEKLTSNDFDDCVWALREVLEQSTFESLSPEDFHFLLGCSVAVSSGVREGVLSRTVDREGLWDDFEVPTLLAHGASDSVVLMIATKRHAASIPEAESSLYTDVGHLPFWEAPERFNRELREFVEER